MTGLLILLGMVLLTVIAGLIHRSRDGRLRAVRSGRVGLANERRPDRTDGQKRDAVAPTHAAARERASLRRAEVQDHAGGHSPAKAQGHARCQDRAAPEGTNSAAAGERPLHPALETLGVSPGSRATLVQFSSAFCAPCRATRRILSDIAELVPGVRHVEIDAEQHLDLVRKLNIRKTPTTLILDAGGTETQRAAGQPRKADVLAALGHALP